MAGTFIKYQYRFAVGWACKKWCDFFMETIEKQQL